VLHLDLFEAAAKHDDAALRARLQQREQKDAATSPLGAWLACREGGDSKAGRAVFHDLEATRCTRCHNLGGTGGNAGPLLDGIGKKLTRDQLLESLITPSARIAEGFGTVTLETKDGDTFVGVVTKEQDGKVTIVSPSGESNDVPSADIVKRTPMAASAMPPMGGALNRRQIRDLIEFLSKQQKG
jgi:putative heme-binding domain-containing protein